MLKTLPQASRLTRSAPMGHRRNGRRLWHHPSLSSSPSCALTTCGFVKLEPQLFICKLRPRLTVVKIKHRMCRKCLAQYLACGRTHNLPFFTFLILSHQEDCSQDIRWQRMGKCPENVFCSSSRFFRSQLSSNFLWEGNLSLTRHIG